MSNLFNHAFPVVKISLKLEDFLACFSVLKDKRKKSIVKIGTIRVEGWNDK